VRSPFLLLQSCEISYQEVNGDISDSSRPKLLLLHGAAFNAATWNKQTGTMAKLREWGYRAVAININNECEYLLLLYKLLWCGRTCVRLCIRLRNRIQLVQVLYDNYR